MAEVSIGDDILPLLEAARLHCSSQALNLLLADILSQEGLPKEAHKLFSLLLRLRVVWDVLEVHCLEVDFLENRVSCLAVSLAVWDLLDEPFWSLLCIATSDCSENAWVQGLDFLVDNSFEACQEDLAWVHVIRALRQIRDGWLSLNVSSCSSSH